MKAIYSTTVEIPTSLFTFRRTFWFATPEDRLAFEKTVCVDFKGARVGTNLNHVMKVNEAVAEVQKELADRTEIAKGNYGEAR